MRRKSASLHEQLPQRSLLRLLGVMLLVIAPHLVRLPFWESPLIVLIAGWRALAATRHWRMPHPAIKVALTISVFAAVIATFGRFWGLNAGVALLVVMLSLKLVELRERRDVMVTVFLMYFLLVTHFLFSQELWTIVYLLVATVSITALLIDVHHDGEPRPLRLLLRYSATMIAQALPLMVLMFVLFPRLPGPLWSLPEDSGNRGIGLSDTMQPGDLSQLALSNELIFRARFLDGVPAEKDRYWRGPVLTDFDGKSWRVSPRAVHAPMPDVHLEGPLFHYEITLEPTHQNWLFALDLPLADHLPEQSNITPEYQLVAVEPVTELRRYNVVSQTRFHLHTQLPPAWRDAALYFPSRSNPRAQALAKQWRAAASSDADVIKSALKLFADPPFAYTLAPPPAADTVDRIDDFLFRTRAGYCEHYAGSFTFLMRAAGIPARVVTGYLGGEKNPLGDWYVLRQLDAHAWSEVWLDGRGWVRVDPTSAVAEERVDHTLEDARSRRDDSRARLGVIDWAELQYRTKAGWDWIDARWNALVLGYGTEQQRDFLSRIGLDDWQSMLLALTGGVTVFLIVIGMVMMRRVAPPPLDAALRLWRSGIRSLRKSGFEQRPDEGASDFIARVLAARPDLATPLQALLQAYLRVRYEEPARPETLRDLAAAARALQRLR